MVPNVFGLARRDNTGMPDPDSVLLWGMETAEGAILYWQEGGRSQFAVFENADRAAERFGPLFDLVLYRP
ncbi:hypothetical protein CDG81_22620 [Actinopolyspora erythraea]|uniref:Uncharacterized protein n=1 Tax=Actinopolyspora erythraea TaxID=414996 RepID=A0A099DBE1_9ACTN|nr:hypothetical protein [Actinopolyspora erythraea]ASU80600.1 hypothetical protein CDG81_22620 [Actinopolyspora erythraea]KGI82720.1 hypothetical protein IL38_02210 [Actinopolyspora erythraea]